MENRWGAEAVGNSGLDRDLFQETGVGEAAMPENTPELSLKQSMREIAGLNRTGMEAGNSGDFGTAHQRLDLSLDRSCTLNRSCLEAKILNNKGVLLYMEGIWGKVFFRYQETMGTLSGFSGKRPAFIGWFKKA
jgi:hypothetical protein